MSIAEFPKHSFALLCLLTKKLGKAQRGTKTKISQQDGTNDKTIYVFKQQGSPNVVIKIKPISDGVRLRIFQRWLAASSRLSNLLLLSIISFVVFTWSSARGNQLAAPQNYGNSCWWFKALSSRFPRVSEGKCVRFTAWNSQWRCNKMSSESKFTESNFRRGCSAIFSVLEFVSIVSRLGLKLSWRVACTAIKVSMR